MSAWPSCFSGSAFCHSRPFYSFLLPGCVCRGHFAEVLRRNPSLAGHQMAPHQSVWPKPTHTTRKIQKTTIKIENIGNIANLSCGILWLSSQMPSLPQFLSQEACSVRLWWWQETLGIQNSRSHARRVQTNACAAVSPSRVATQTKWPRKG